MPDTERNHTNLACSQSTQAAKCPQSDSSQGDSRHNRRTFLKTLTVATAVYGTTQAVGGIDAADRRGSPALPLINGSIAVGAIKRLAHGVEITLATGTLRLIVYSSHVIRIYMSPRGDPQADHKSMAVIKQPVTTAWHLHETPEYIALSTAVVTAHVDRKTSAVTFSDSAGRKLLSEVATGGKFMTPSKFKDVETFRVRQEFDLPADEALYGLGQHQQGVMNYHGTVVRLEQSNRHIAVPVLLSNYGYGIFWDNPAITEVNAGTAAVESIPPENLIDEHGRSGALTAYYFSGTDFRNLVATGLDPHLMLNWQSEAAEAIAAGKSPKPFSVRWKGRIRAAATGTYTFSATINGDFELQLDHQVILTRLDGHPNTTLTGKIHLQAGREYDLDMHYVHHAERTQMALKWQLPATAQQARTLSWSSEVGDCIDYYFIYGPTADNTIAAWRAISGEVPMLGKWVWGYWQSKCMYSSQAQILGVAAEYRSMNIPIDAVVQDLFYWQPAPWGSNKFDPLRYPAPADMISELHRENIHLMISVWAQFAPGSANYRQLEQAGVLYTSHCKDRYYDAFNPRARRLYWNELKTQLLPLGVDAWWLDASEPQLCNNWGEFADIKTNAGYGAFVYNAYPLMHTTAVYQGQREATSSKRVMILTRSAWAGQQRNSTVVWSGDIPGTWQVLREQIPAGINFSLSGLPYWNTDIGGFFSGDPQDPSYCELFIRWFQFGAFCPMFRVHGTNYAKEMWRFGPATMTILEKFNHLRYRLLPYIYSVAWMVTNQGYSMLRGLVMDFPTDRPVLDIPDQFMFGPAIMASPVLQPHATSRSVYLPAPTRWYDFWTGEQHSGGASMNTPAALDCMPLHVRAGSILPLGPVVQYAALPADPLEIRVYPGADGTFTLYEDENDNYNYERGVYSQIAFTWDDHNRTFSISPRQGQFPGMMMRRTFHIVLVRPGQGNGVTAAPHPDHIIHYTGAAVVVKI